MTSKPETTGSSGSHERGALGHEDTVAPQSNRTSGLGRNMRMTAIFLLVSAVVFCMIVVRQRDANRMKTGLKWAEKIEQHIQGVWDERKGLPRSLPLNPEVAPETLRVPYPPPSEISRLEIQEQPFVLIAGPVKGLIRPGGDGCAVVLFDCGRVSTEWMTKAAVDAALERRNRLVAGPPTGDG